jgi:hypothetical protein
MGKVISVPGRFDGANCFLDLETVKVPTNGFVMKNGEALKNRWSVALAGVAMAGDIMILDGTEAKILAVLGDCLALADAVIYSATRQFDEMICKGRFTNARRAHEPVAFFPAVPGAEDLAWYCERGDMAWDRGDDVPSREVPAALKRGDREVVEVHLLRDVAELILMFGNPDVTCDSWCQSVLADYDFCVDILLKS